MKCSKILLIATAISFVLLVGLIFVAIFAAPEFTRIAVENNRRLSNTQSDYYNSFINDEYVEKSFSAYIFEVENADNVLLGLEKPRLTEKGPFEYSKICKKVEVNLNGDVYINYKEDCKYYPKDNQSISIRMINPLVNSIYQIFEKTDLDFNPELLMEEVIEEGYSEIIQDFEVNKILFEGIKLCDPLKISSTEAKMFCLTSALLDIELFDYNQDGSMIFSLYGHKNRISPKYEVDTGDPNFENIGKLNYFDGKQPWGNDSQCLNRYRYDRLGDMFPKAELVPEPNEIFFPDLCIDSRFMKTDETNQENVDLYVFKMDQNIFVDQNPEESCYCIEETLDIDGEKNCYLNGVIDLYSCLGLPFLYSLPYFENSDPKYLESIEIAESNSDFSSDFQVDTIIGSMISLNQKFQSNIVLRPIKLGSYNILETIKRSYLPLYWYHEKMIYNDASYDHIVWTLKVQNAVAWSVVAAFGLITIACGVGYFVAKKKE